ILGGKGISVYRWSDLGYGTRFANPTMPSPTVHGVGVTFTKKSAFIVVTSSTYSGDNPNYVSIYHWSSEDGFGTKLADPSEPIVGLPYRPRFKSTEDVFVFTHEEDPCITAYEWSESGLGSKFADPSNPPTGDGFNSSFGEAFGD